jgi:DNA-binding beta-propeller fold protein YncE
MRRTRTAVSLAAAALLLGAGSSLLGTCGPFSDVTDAAFCPFVLEIFTLGITTGTTPTTYDPSGGVTRLQMAAFLSRSVDGALRRGSRRAVVKKFWTTQGAQELGLTDLGTSSVGGNLVYDIAADGQNVWLADDFDDTVKRVRASDGKLLETWTGAVSSIGLVSVPSGVFVIGNTTPGRLYRIDPSHPAGAVTTVASGLGGKPLAVTFDGARFWTTNFSSISIVTAAATIPWTATTVTAGFVDPFGLVFDGSNIWVTDLGPGTVLKLDSVGTILQTVTTGPNPQGLVFDGSSLWVLNSGSDSVSIVRASSGAVLATLTGNGLAFPFRAAFDGERVLVIDGGSDRVSLWKAADLTPLGFFSTGAGTNPLAVASDGLNFWIALVDTNQLARF